MANSRLCSIPDCGKPIKGHGWCRKHLERWRRRGDPLAVKYHSPARDFYEREVLTYEGDECLIWPYARSEGYGKLQTKVVSRLVCEYVHGPAPTPAHEAAHSCGRGHEGCVTKSHVSWKTSKENNADKFLHGTHVCGERHGKARITEEQARTIYALKGEVSQKKIAEQLNVSLGTVEHIHDGSTWSWLFSP